MSYVVCRQYVDRGAMAQELRDEYLYSVWEDNFVPDHLLVVSTDAYDDWRIASEYAATLPRECPVIIPEEGVFVFKSPSGKTVQVTHFPSGWVEATYEDCSYGDGGLFYDTVIHRMWKGGRADGICSSPFTSWWSYKNYWVRRSYEHYANWREV